jgi:hypothetical protein
MELRTERHKLGKKKKKEKKMSNTEKTPKKRG